MMQVRCQLVLWDQIIICRRAASTFCCRAIYSRLLVFQCSGGLEHDDFHPPRRPRLARETPEVQRFCRATRTSARPLAGDGRGALSSRDRPCPPALTRRRRQKSATTLSPPLHAKHSAGLPQVGVAKNPPRSRPRYAPTLCATALSQAGAAQTSANTLSPRRRSAGRCRARAAEHQLGWGGVERAGGAQRREPAPAAAGDGGWRGSAPQNRAEACCGPAPGRCVSVCARVCVGGEGLSTSPGPSPTRRNRRGGGEGGVRGARAGRTLLPRGSSPGGPIRIEN